MRILICGGREWSLLLETERLLSHVLRVEDTIIHGNARGADRMAMFIALKIGVAVRPYPARWDLYGRAAGPIRNQQMLDEGRPEMVLALHKDLSHSRGTRDMVRRSIKAGIDTFHFDGRVIRQVTKGDYY